MKEKFVENEVFQDFDKKVYNASIQLWAESIIKHNLDFNMTKVQHINLISNQNSKEVIDVFGKIMFEDKSTRTTQDFEVLRMQAMIANYLDLIVLSLKQDICTELKNEFIEYQNLKLNNGNKNKLK